MKLEKWETETSRGLISAFVLAAILLVTGGYFYLKSEIAVWNKQADKQLKDIAISKSGQVGAWRQEKLADAREIAQSPLLQDAVTDWKNHQNREELKNEILQRLQVVIQNHSECINVVLTDTTSRIILSGKPGEAEFAGHSTRELIGTVIKTRKESIGDLFKLDNNSAGFMNIASPILDKKLDIQAVILFRVDASRQLNDLLQSGDTTSSQEAFLFGKAGDSIQYLTKLRRLPNAALSLKIPLANTQNPAVRALKNGPGFYDGIGYQGQKVLEYIQPVSGSPWFLASKINQDELYGPVYKRVKIVSTVLFLLFVSFSALILLIVNYRRKHFFRQLLEVELQKAALKSHYEYVVKYANDSILLEDDDLNIVDANESAQKAYQYSLEELKKLKKTDLVAPGFRKEASERLKNLDKNEGYIVESVHQRKDGSLFNVEISARHIQIDGRIFLHQVIRDITERKQAEVALRESEERFRTTLYSTGDAIITTDPNGQIRYMNPVAEKLTEWTEAEASGKPIREVFRVFNEDTHEEIESPIEKVLDKGMVVMLSNHTFLKTKHGNEIPIGDSGAPIRDVDGKIAGVVLVFRDQTPEREAQRKIRESEEKYRMAFQTSPDAVNINRLDGLYVEINEGFTSLMGFTRDEVIGKFSSEIEIWAIPEDREKLIAGLKEKGFVYNLESSFRCKDGSLKTALMSANLITLNNEPHILSITRDITEFRMNANALKERETFLNDLLATIPLPVFYKDKSGKYLDANNAFVSLFGFSKDQLIGKTPFDLYPPDLAKIYQEKDEELLHSGGTQVYESRFVDAFGIGHDVIFHKATYKNAQNEVSGLIGIVIDITEQKQTQALQFRLLNIIEKSLNEIFVFDAVSLKFESANQGALENLGFSLEEFVQMTPVDIKPEFTDETFRKTIEPLISGAKDKLVLETRHKRKDGSTYPVEIHLQLNKSGDKNVFLAIANDISQRLKSTEALNESHERWENLFNNSPTAIAVYRAVDNGNDFVFSDFNLQAQKTDNFMRDEVIGKRITELFPAADQAGFLDVFRKVWRTGHTEHQPPTLYKDDRIEGWRENIIYKLNNEEVVAIYSDVSDKMKAEIALRESEENFRSYFENSPLGKSITGMDGSMKVNQAFCQMLGYSKEEMEQLNFKEITHPDDLQMSEDMMNSLISGDKKTISFEKRFVHKNGASIWTELVASLHHDSEGKPAYFITTVQDITERRKLIEEIIAAKEKAQESDRLKSAFLATMSHELRTPLNAVIGFSGLIEEGVPESQILSFAHIIHRSGNSLLEIIEGILELTLLESGELVMHPKWFSLAQLMSTLFNTALDEQTKANKPHLDIECVSCNSDDQIQLYSDPTEINKIFSQLFRNAFKFTKSGKVQFGYIMDSDGDAAQINFYINDTGIGIPSNQQSIIFERFRQIDDSHTRKFGGTGIGLTIAKHKVELLGGRIWVDSMPGQGSTFYFSIPITKPKSIFEKSSELIEMPKSQHTSVNHTILIAEDDKSNFLLIKHMLSQVNLEILHALDGYQAIELFKTHPEIKLVLMDVNMPNMNGHEATQKVKALRPEIPVIVVTAYAMSGDREKSLTQGCDDYLEKPIKRDQLLKVVQKFIS